MSTVKVRNDDNGDVHGPTMPGEDDDVQKPTIPPTRELVFCDLPPIDERARGDER